MLISHIYYTPSRTTTPNRIIYLLIVNMLCAFPYRVPLYTLEHILLRKDNLMFDKNEFE